MWQYVGLLGLCWAVAAQLGFTLRFAPRGWWRNQVGRALFSMAATLLAVLVVTLVNAFVDYPGQLQVGAALLCAIAAAITWQWVMAERQWKRARRSDRP